jgi:hypothetical protein
MQRRWWLWVGVVLLLRLLEWRLLPMFVLTKDVNGVLELHESCPFSVYALPSGFGTLSYSLPSCDNFLFLTETLDLLLNSV